MKKRKNIHRRNKVLDYCEFMEEEKIMKCLEIILNAKKEKLEESQLIEITTDL